MAKIFVANATKQIQELSYRRPIKLTEAGERWGKRLYTESIRPGQQIQLPGDFTDDEAKGIFEHHSTNFGAVRASDRKPGFRGLIFSDQPIPLGKIENAIEADDEAAVRRSDGMLDATGAAMLEKQNNMATETGAPAPKRVELEVANDSGKGKGPTDGEGKGVEVPNDGVAPRNAPTRK